MKHINIFSFILGAGLSAFIAVLVVFALNTKQEAFEDNFTIVQYHGKKVHILNGSELYATELQNTINNITVQEKGSK